MARVVAVLLGYDHLPGATLTRYCSSSLQTTRMALTPSRRARAMSSSRRGGDGVASAKGNCDSLPDTMNPVFAGAEARTAEAAAGRRGKLAGPARGRRRAGHLHLDGPDRGEPGALKGIAARRWTSSASARRTWPKRRSPTGSGRARSRR